MKNFIVLAMIFASTSAFADLTSYIGKTVVDSTTIYKLLYEKHNDLQNENCLAYGVRKTLDFDLITYAGFYADSLKFIKGPNVLVGEIEQETIRAIFSLKSIKNASDIKTESFLCSVKLQ